MRWRWRWTTATTAAVAGLVLAATALPAAWFAWVPAGGSGDGPAGTARAHPPPTAPDGDDIRVTLSGYEARWRPGEVALTVHLVGEVFDGGDGAPNARVTGHVNVTTGDPCWGPVFCPQVVTTKEKDLDFRTNEYGTYHVHVTFTYSSTLTPPVQDPYCENLHAHVLVENATRNVAEREGEFGHACTQAYPW